MARQTGHERETLRISAETATKLLTKLHEERDKIDARITSLEAVVTAYDTLVGRRTKAETETANGKKRAPKGQVLKHVEAVLQDGEYDEPSLRKAIADKFGANYGRATVYTCLRRGANEHRFLQNGKKWSLNLMRVEQTKV